MLIGYVTILGLGALLSVPLTTAFFAKRMGRRPWLWFLISCALPLISTFILVILPDLSTYNNSQNHV